MRLLLDLAVALAQRWTALYTHGLPSDPRVERREEVDCDLWEHQRLADLRREPVAGTAAAILLRFLLGIPADILWRLETGASARSGKGTQMNDSWIMRGALVAAVMVGLSPIGFGVSVLYGNSDGLSAFERVAFSLLWIAAGLAMGAGLLLSRSRPSLGLGLLAVGVIGISVMWYWAAVITLPIGLVLLTIAYFRAGRPGWPTSARAA
ncbi:MAG TPA: hypothetical protein VMR52_08690 [Dehalococcoidia bacterium]|nr:hypothetical protein [Dehalococcoidia bacterium]